MKKFVLKLDLQDDKDKRRALKTISALQGVDFISIDMKNRHLTIIGSVDPIVAVSRLRRIWPTTVIIAVGPAVEPEKKEEEGKKKKEEEEAKKEDPEKEKAKKEAESVPPVIGIMPFRQYYPPVSTYYYNHPSMEENPNACVIC